MSARLGAGGSGEVYRATDLRIGRPVALKVFTLEDATPADVRRYAAEARVLAGLSHPGLVALYDVGADIDPRLGPVAFLAMELVEGATLRDTIAAGPLPPVVTAEVGHQLAQALAHAHAAGVVHRDIKPSNVLVAQLDGAPVVMDQPVLTVVLADFGIATHSRRGAAGGGATTSSGTASYHSPEQALGREVGPPSDVFSLGLVLLECRTGARTYPGAPLASSLARLLGPVPVPPDLGPEWVELLTAMTASEPEERPTASAVAAALSALRA
ncbi:serine/threonine-protein kinase [Cellulomonas edaphi]|uniref:non-specific serine/threonine protein kinase n=1 Tax=Cellulomonas edaphi TaxID=3053468 RepID=A0ABT7S865_9CELL|nr:serine/threonine-protein kinase [Cellulomons edaphi]MDM7831803.1 serine/threonine-protein kinase [Cellulomons edaphi]